MWTKNVAIRLGYGGSGPRVVNVIKLYIVTTETNKQLEVAMALHAPKTLQEWRSQKLVGYPRTAWIPLESFFLSRGYTLWPHPPTTLHPIPPNDAPRAPDGFAYRTVYCEIKPNKFHFDMIVS